MRKQFTNVGFWEVPIKIDYIVHIQTAYIVFFVCFFYLIFVVLCVCKRNRPVFVDFSMFNQTGVHHIFETFSVFSVVDVIWE